MDLLALLWSIMQICISGLCKTNYVNVHLEPLQNADYLPDVWGQLTFLL